MNYYERLPIIFSMAAFTVVGMFISADVSWCASVPVLSTLPAIMAEAKKPVRIAADSAGNFYITDPKAGGILKFNTAGSFKKKISTPAIGAGIAVAKNGDILVTQGTYVAVFDPATGLEKVPSRFGVGVFLYANGIAVDTSGNIYVTDGQANNIQKFSSTYGVPLASSSVTLTRPAGITYEKVSNTLYVANSLSSNIQIMNTSLSSVGSFGVAGYISAPAIGSTPDFTYPQSIAFEYDPTGQILNRIYVADSYQSTVEVLDGTNRTWLKRIGGSGFAGGKIYEPRDIFFDQFSPINKRLFVAHSGGNIVEFGIDNMQPTEIRIINPTSSSLTVSWVNPVVAGFSYIRIYRSTAAGTLGSVIITNPIGTSFTDTGLASGRSYYYTVRAVDTSNTEYATTLQVAGTTK